MPLDLGHDAARLLPTLCLIAETSVEAAHLVWRSPDRALEQVADSVLQDGICWQPDRVADPLGFKKFVDLGIGKSRVTAKIETLHDASVADNHRLYSHRRCARCPASGRTARHRRAG